MLIEIPDPIRIALMAFTSSVLLGRALQGLSALTARLGMFDRFLPNQRIFFRC